MAIVRDVHPPERPGRPLDLKRAAGGEHVQASRGHRERRTTLVRDVSPRRGTTALATIVAWAGQRIRAWRTLRQLRPAKPVRFPRRDAALTLDLGQRGPALHGRARPIAPFAVGLAVLTLLLLGGIVGIRLIAIEGAARDRAVAALDASRLGLGALARSETALATTHFSDARGSLSEAQGLLEQLSVDTALRSLSPAEHSAMTVRAADAALAAGEDLSSALDALRRSDIREAILRASTGLEHLRAADEQLAHVGPLLPASLRTQVATAQSQLHDLRTRLSSLEEQLPTLRTLAGANGPTRYLLVFQNTAERRGTGGFMGSVAIAEFDALALTRFEFKDIYTIDWKQQNLEPAPSGLRRYYETLHLRDANYSPDFPTAAAWIEKGFISSGGKPLDGIVAIDSDVFFDLLDALGPFTLPGTTTTLTRDTAFDLITVRIETSKKDPESPKAVLKDLLPLITTRLQDRTTWGAVAGVLEKGIAGGHIRAYAKDPSVERLATDLGINGRLPAARPGEDELALVSTSVGGNKSDRFISQRVEHIATVSADGRVQDDLMIEKTFRIPDGFEERIAPLLAGRDQKTTVYLRSVLGDAMNQDYLRVYLPRGTTIREVTGVPPEDWDIREELGRTVVGIHMKTHVDTVSRVHLRYDLPFTLDLRTAATYRLSARRTPGLAELALAHELRVAPGLRIVGTEGDRLLRDLSGNADAASAAVLTRTGDTLEP